MKFSFSAIGRNLLQKIPTIALLAMVVVGTTHFNHFPAHSQPEPVVTDPSQEWVRGYADVVPVILELDDNQLIDTVKLGDNNETRAYIKKMQREGLFDQWDGMSLVEVEQSEVEAVSGATYSSNAVIANVRMEAARIANISSVPRSECTVDWWAQQIVAWVVLLIAVLSYLMPTRMKRWRWVLIVATVGLLGFWQGTFLSMQMLYNYVVGGSSLLQITLTVILVLAIAAPLLFNKSFYCQYLCPFGMLQEAAGRIPVKKLKLSPRVIKQFSWSRRVLFVGFVILVWINPLFSMADWEPFSAFIAVRDVLNFGAVSVLIIAGVSVLVSVFVPRAWCKILCPTGEFFRILQNAPSFMRRAKK